jgi:hypothetical protein
MDSVALGSFFLAISLVGSALTALKLTATGLYRHYPVFFLYFIFRIPNSIWPLLLSTRSPHYFAIWRVSFVLTLVFYVFLVVELYRLVLKDYRGLQTVGRWAMYASVAAAAGISILTLLSGMSLGRHEPSRIIRIFLIAERGIDTALALFIVLLLAILSRYPIQLSRNVRVHAVVYSTFFLSNTVGLLLRSYFGLELADVANVVITAIGACSVFAWLILLNPAGEKIHSALRTMQPEHEKRLLIQLNGLNATMLRLARQQPR